MANKLLVSFDIEPIVKLKCRATGCKHNVIHKIPDSMGVPCCNLKHMMIDADGKCMQMEDKKGK